MLRKSGSGGQNDDRAKKGSSGSSKEGTFGKNWGKLNRTKTPQALAEKTIAANSGKAELNATILQALTAIDTPEATLARTTGAFSKPAAPVANKAPDPDASTAKTEVTATGLGSQEVLNVMWEHLELMTNQYNAIVGPGPFHLKLNHETEGKSRASIATLTHCLIIIPDTDAVRLYVLPVELNRGEYGQGPQFEPNSIVLMTKRGSRIEWHTKMGEPLTAAVMNATCRSLFQSLIEHTASFYA